MDKCNFSFAKMARFMNNRNEEPIGFLPTKSSSRITEDQHAAVVNSIIKHMPKHRSNILYEKYPEAADEYETENQSFIFVRIAQPQHYNVCSHIIEKVDEETHCDYEKPWSIGQCSDLYDFDNISDFLSHLPDKPCISYSISIAGMVFDEEENEHVQTLTHITGQQTSEAFGRDLETMYLIQMDRSKIQ